MAAVLLDTTVLIDLLRGRPRAVDRLRTIRSAGDQPYVCAINVEELERGAKARETDAIARVLDGVLVAQLGRGEGARAGQWRREHAARGVTLSQADCLIASAAVAVGARLATGNPKDFPMTGLAVEHWPVGDSTMASYGIHVANTGVPDLVAMAQRAEAAGVPTLWLTSGLGADSLTSLAVVGARTERIKLGTAIAIAYSRHPLAMIQQARAIEDAAPGRLRLGVGTSHKQTVETTWGLSFDHPLGFLREYLEVLHQARTGEVDFDGTRIHVHAKLQAPVEVPLLISALRPTAYRLAGELADGAIAWITPTAFLRDVAGPAMRESAMAHGRPRPVLVGHAFALVTSDAAAARATGLERLAGYTRMPFYAAMFGDAGYPDAADGVVPDALADDLVLVGSEQQVADGLRRFAGAGCDEVIVSLLPGSDADIDRTLALLDDLSR